jgi:hypothetical protein
MKKIYTENLGGVAVLISDEDYEWARQYKWFVGKRGYIVRNVKIGDKWTRRTMHREINKTPAGFDTEHSDQNKHNNQRNNLRNGTRSQNMANVSRIKKETSHSKYKGVSRLKRSKLKNQWLAYIKLNYKMYWLCYYETQEEAAHMYNQFAEQIYGEFASLNDI